jgi:hypothetical protein
VRGWERGQSFCILLHTNSSKHDNSPFLLQCNVSTPQSCLLSVREQRNVRGGQWDHCRRKEGVEQLWR